MRKLKVGEFEFKILSEEEIDCEHSWEPYSQYVTVNPNQEFIIGYGRTPVCVPVIVGRQCSRCSLIEMQVGLSIRNEIKPDEVPPKPEPTSFTEVTKSWNRGRIWNR